MKVSDYNYSLPDDLIADRPPKVRGTSKLLILNKTTGSISDGHYSDIVNILHPGDLLILNDTKVIKARLITKNYEGKDRELVILEKHGQDDDWYRHKVLYRHKLRAGDNLSIGRYKLEVESILGGGVAIIKSSVDLLKIAEEYGDVPLPPYMKRKSDDCDIERYQTVWAKNAGSVAAPTASLNMTDEIISKLKSNNINVAYITLHVGLGTFLPIRSDDVEEHVMHKEYFEISEATIKAINHAKSSGGRIVAVGTTVARTLEYANKLIVQGAGGLSGEADIFIYPGYQFKLVDCLITNYHAPKSTVLMLAAAFAGWDNLLKAYNHAIDKRYHFLSYGDSMIIL